MKASLPTKPMYCSREYSNTSRLIQQYEKSTSNPNLYLVPMIHNVDTYVTENIPMVLINFWVDDISIAKGEIMGFLQNQSLDISEIMTETSTEPSPIMIEEDNVTEVLQKQGEKKFITSPADIDVHQK